MAENEPLFPECHVQLTGENGNAYNLLGIVRRALRQHGVPEDEVKDFMSQAMKGDYDHLLLTCMKWVDVS